MTCLLLLPLYTTLLLSPPVKYISRVTAIFCVAIYLIALGNEAPEPTLDAFGADQFDEEVPSNGEGLYGVERKEGKNNGARRIIHIRGFKYLDRAVNITPADVYRGEPSNPWQLCTITQVEEVKSILRLLPIWSCTVLSSVVFIQMLSLFVEQGAAMDTTVSNFHIPPATMFTFDIISTSTFILLYTKLTKREPNPPSELQRIGFGMAMAMTSMIFAAIIKQQRLKPSTAKTQVV
ncbi:hypothetical protein GQ457_06G023690 [Hibiscus cannabinus]